MGELTGTTFAGLEVRDAVGRDLVSTVYQAVESDGDRVVALRIVAEDLCAGDGDDRELYQRFLRRAGAALTFDHPNAPRVEEVGEHRGRGYLITPHVDTMQFDDYVTQEGPLDLGAAVALFSQVADVLDAGHRAGLTHGALNPTTLRIATPIDAPATVHLTGFGIGALLELRLRRDRKHLRDVDELLYVAPEQLRRQPLTGRTDQYAMACALMHAMTGAPPFERDSVGGLFGAHLFVTPTVDEGNASEHALLKALAKEPRDRYATCGQLLSDMTRAGQSAVNRRRSDTRRRRALAHGWLNDAGESTVAAPPAATSTMTDEPSIVISLPAHEDEPVPTAEDNGVAPTRGTRSPGPVAADPPPAAAPAEPDDEPAVDVVADDRTAPSATPGDGAPPAADDEAAVDVDADDGTAPAPAAADVEDRATGGGASSARADSALSNGDRSVPARARAEAAPVEKSSTARPGPADIAYPAAGDEPEPVPATEAAEDLDDVPLLSEVLSRRPYHPEPAAQRPSAALVGLSILAVIAVAVTVWLIIS